jgi:hypothetical protein
MAQQLYQRETQYFGFSPINIVDLGIVAGYLYTCVQPNLASKRPVINSVNDYVVDGAQGVRKYLLENEQSPFKDDDAIVTEVCSLSTIYHLL